MPAGISNPVLGYATFCAIKFAGYSAAGHFLSVQYDRDVSAWKVGAVRTLIGMAAGAAYSGLWLVIDPNVFQPRAEPSLLFPWGYLAGLLPVRIAEWWLLIWLFFDRELRDVAKGWRMVGLGTIWSYLLDVPAIAGLIATVGIWVC